MAWIDPIEECWRYMTGGSPSKFAMHKLANNHWVSFKIWQPRKTDREPNLAASDPREREGRMKGLTVKGWSRTAPSSYLGAIDLKTRHFGVTRFNPERAELPQTKAFIWLLGRFNAGEWPLRGVQLQHDNLCRVCFRRVEGSKSALMPPYPICERCRAKAHPPRLVASNGSAVVASARFCTVCGEQPVEAHTSMCRICQRRLMDD